jgi:hypothetical protein
MWFKWHRTGPSDSVHEHENFMKGGYFLVYTREYRLSRTVIHSVYINQKVVFTL